MSWDSFTNWWTDEISRMEFYPRSLCIVDRRFGNYLSFKLDRFIWFVYFSSYFFFHYRWNRFEVMKSFIWLYNRGSVGLLDTKMRLIFGKGVVLNRLNEFDEILSVVNPFHGEGLCEVSTISELGISRRTEWTDLSYFKNFHIESCIVSLVFQSTAPLWLKRHCLLNQIIENIEYIYKHVRTNLFSWSEDTSTSVEMLRTTSYDLCLLHASLSAFPSRMKMCAHLFTFQHN